MSGFQFVHVETYSRKADKGGRTVGFVLDEAERKVEASTHVERPGEPETVFGMGVHDVRALHDARLSEARSEVTGGKARKVRVDQHTLLTVVASHPATMDQVRSDPAVAAGVRAWEDRTVEWLRETWGDRLAGVIRHGDESHPHLHAYVLPDDGGMKAKALHPGVEAKANAKAEALAEGVDAKGANAIGDKAYKVAMRGLQDGYWERVGLPSGMARLGPGRRRLDRDAWKTEQSAAAATARALEVARAAHVEAATIISGATAARVEAETRAASLSERGAAYVAAARAAAAVAKADADAAMAAAARAREAESAARSAAAALIQEARREAAATVRAAEERASRARRIGTVLGAVWSGLAGVGRRIELRAEHRVRTVRSEAKTAVSAAAATARASVADEILQLRGQLAGVSHLVVNAEAKARKAEASAAVERAGRLKAESERESFRSRWAAADNKLQARRSGLSR